MTHWSMLPGADKLAIHIVNRGEANDIECICDAGRRYIEGGWPIHGWRFHAGQCCDCMNIRVFHNGAEPADFTSEDAARVEFAGENSDAIHICDLDAFIEMLLAIKAAKEPAAVREP